MIELLDELRQRGIRLRVEDGRLKFSAPKGALTDDLRARIAAERTALIALLGQTAAAPAAVESPVRDAAGPAPLSHAQQRLWVVAHIDGLGAAYAIPGAACIDGPLDPAALADALAVVMRRQASLRTALRLVDGQPRQVVEPNPPLPWAIEDLTDESDPEAAARARLDALAALPFDLAVAPLYRARLLRLGPQRHVFGIVLHHAIADGWSISLLLRELGSAYATLRAGEAPDDTPVSPGYAALAAFERGPAGQARIDRQLDYWRQKLADAPALLELPADRPRPPLQSFAGASVSAVLPAGTVTALAAVAQAEGATLFMGLFAVFAVLIARYTGEADVVVGTPLAGRDRAQTQGLIGLFVNTLPLRCDLSGEPDFRTVLARVRRTVLEAFDHQDVPFERLVETMQLARDARYPPLCQVLFALQSALDERLELAGATLTPLRLETGTSKVDLFLAVEPRADGSLGLEAEYCSALFEPARMARLLGHFIQLATAAAQAPATPVASLALMSASERDALLLGRNPATLPLAPPLTLPARVAAVTARQPEAVAVSFDQSALTYLQLADASQRLAAALADAGVAAGEVVGVYMPRGLHLPVALLGILCAGAAYLPLALDLPAARRRDMLADAGVRVVATDRASAAELADEGVEAIAVDALPPASCALPVWPDDPDALAYVMYTSGSTGGPKGVCVTHRNVLRLVDGMAYDGPPPRAALQLAPLAFDASTLEIWTALTSGARLVIAPPEPVEPASLAAVIQHQGIDLLWLTAGLFQRLADSLTDTLAGVRYVLTGGDVVPAAAAQAVLDRMAARGHHGHRLGNGYGPTECTTFTAVHWMRPGERLGASIPIGRPIGHTRVYVVDGKGQPVPEGVPGELWVGGPGVARGYLRRPALTAERFLPDPFGGDGRVYRTGDRVAWRSDGTLAFLGRLDRQMKLRGFRIEPGEIEQALLDEPGIAAAVVVLRDADSGAKQLVAYVVADSAGEAPSLDGLRAALASRLPAYMVPTHILCLERLPLNRSGKVDRHALPVPMAAVAPTAARPPTGVVETALAAIWRRLLGRDDIAADDNFFALGGDSILAMQLVLHAGEAGLAFGLRDVLEQQTIAGLAARHAEVSADTAVSVEGVEGPLPLSPIQRWFFARRLARPAHWNQAVLLALRIPVSRERLHAGLDRLAGRHEALRQRFHREGDGWRVVIAPTATVPLAVHTLADDTEQAALADAVQASLDLAHGPVFAAAWFRRGDGVDHLLLVAHHLVVDAVSWRLLIHELSAVLTSDHAPMDPPPVPWSAYVTRLAGTTPPGIAELHSAMPAARRHPASEPGDDTCTPLPLDHATGQNEEATAATVEQHLDPTETDTFLGSTAQRTDPTELLLAALSAALLDWSGGTALVVDVERHGRDVVPGLDLSRTVGWFTRLAPCRVVWPVTDSPEAWLAAARTAQPIPGHTPVAGATRTAARTAQLSTSARAQVSLNYLGRLDGADEGPLVPVDGPTGALYGAGAERVHLFELIAAVIDGRLQLSLRYSPARHHQATARRLAEAIATRLSAILTWRAQPDNGRLLASDVPLAGLDQPRLDRLLARIGAADDRHPASAIETILPLSPQQQGMLFDSLAGAGSGVHHEQFLIRLAGDLDPAALATAWRQAAARHSILRTAFVWDDLPQPLQVVFDTPHLTLTRHRGVPDDTWLSTDRLSPIDLSRPGAFRLTLWQAATASEAPDSCGAPPGIAELHSAIPIDDRHPANERNNAPGQIHSPSESTPSAPETQWLLVWTFHHLLLDGWSIALLLREVMTLYEAGRTGQAPALPPAAPYGDYVAWLAGHDRTRTLAFWRDELTGVPEVPPLAFAGADAAVAGDAYDERRLELDAAHSRALGALARRRAITPGTLFQAAWSLLLARLLRSDDLVIGITTAGRPETMPGSQTCAGLFIDTLPLRVALPADGDVGDWLSELFARNRRVLAHPHVGAGLVHKAAGYPPERPLFETLLVYENYPRDADPAGLASGLRVVDVETRGARTRYPLTLLVVPGERLRLQLIVDRRRVPPALAGRLLALLERLLVSLAEGETRMASLRALVDAAGLPEPVDEAANRPLRRRPAALPETALEGALAEIWCEILGRRTVPVDCSFFELGGHSLMVLEMAAAVERRLGLAVDAGLLFQAPTVRGLAGRLARLDLSGAATVVTLAEGQGTPLVVFPGASGNPLAYLPLARRLAGRPVLGVQVAGLLTESSIETMAARLIECLPAGPLHLMGHSFGAALAYEIARQLVAGDRTTGLVALVDLPAPTADAAAAAPGTDAELMAEIARAAARYFDRPIALAAADLDGVPGRPRFLAALAAAGLVSAHADETVVDALLGMYRRSLDTLAAWRPQPLAGPIEVVRAAQSEATTATGAADLGWARWATVARAVVVPGDHIGVIVEPAVAALADVLRKGMLRHDTQWETARPCASPS